MKYLPLLIMAFLSLTSCDKSPIEQIKAVTEDKYPVANMPDEPLDKPLEILREPKRLAMTTTWSAGVKDDGTLWTWGTGSLLRPAQTGQDPTPRPVEGIHDAVAVSGGGGHMLLLRKDGTVWGWGSNHDGEIDPSDKDTSIDELRQIKGIDNVVDIVAGLKRSFFLTNDGYIYALGNSEYGSINGITVKKLDKPTKMEGFENITRIEGSSFIYGITKDGKLLSNVPTHNATIIKKLSNDYDVGVIPFDKPVVDISNGFSDLALLNDGTVWSWGDWAYTGLNKGKQDIKNPQRIKSLSKITNVGIHSVTTQKGEIYTWGTFVFKSNLTSIGSTKEYIFEPILIAKNTPVLDFSNGFFGTGCIDKDGNAWFWGDNELGRRGTGKVYPEKFAPKDYILKPEKSIFNLHH